jgi:hypothetical protein
VGRTDALADFAQLGERALVSVEVTLSGCRRYNRPWPDLAVYRGKQEVLAAERATLPWLHLDR